MAVQNDLCSKQTGALHVDFADVAHQSREGVGVGIPIRGAQGGENFDRLSALDVYSWKALVVLLDHTGM